MRKKVLSFALLAELSFVILFAACSEIFDVYKNPEFDRYNIHRIALLPMVWDDTTEDGTYYSTNHFINKIYDEREDVDLADIDSLRKLDCLHLLTMFNNIGDKTTINPDSIYASAIGNYLAEYKCDVILVGTIDTSWVYHRSSINNYSLWATTYSKFNYYMFSLSDGKLLWRVRVKGGSDVYVPDDDVYYPPLDAAISAGIDYFFDKFPFKKKAKLNCQ